MPYRAQTEIEAANLALGEIGEPPIGTFNDRTTRARKCALWFGTVRDDTQRAHDWGFNAAWFVPAMNPVPALGRFKHRFAMPNDCLKVRDVLPYRPPPGANNGGILITDPTLIAQLESDMGAPRERGWDMEAASVGTEPPIAAMVLVTNIHQPVVNISRRIAIVKLWPADYLTAFVTELAAKLAPAIARDVTAGERLHGDYKDSVDEAARTDSREQSPKHISRDTSWVGSRMLGRGWRGR